MLEKFSRNIEDYPEGIVLPIDKPYRWTSADVIRKIKYAAIKHFGKKNLKVGHAGTLDPLATGILLVCIGPATKRAEELQASPKQYIAGVTFGAMTASYDLEKELENFTPYDKLNAATLTSTLPNFIGTQEQIPPLFSAKSVDGIRAYETARKLYKQGKSLDTENILNPSIINIYDAQLLELKSSKDNLPPQPKQGESTKINVASLANYDLPTAMVQIDCSKGTYIRAFARDLGEALGTNAFLSSLRRTKNGGFTIKNAISLEEALKLLS